MRLLNLRVFALVFLVAGCTSNPGTDGGLVDGTGRMDARTDAFADTRVDATVSDLATDGPIACTGPGTCPSGFACVNSLCVRGTGPCTGDDMCHNDARCIDGTCVRYGESGSDHNMKCMRPA